ncbi:hypothetical protein MBLNU459_g3107t1 [Dothideomycetes sp. NU459]
MDSDSINSSKRTSPQTPPRRDSHEHDSNHVRKASFATDSSGDTTIPPRPFLAYARRVRSFSSPFQLNKSRYLLTFVDADAAQEWWRLMQVEYPDSVRESPQLFSFKGDKVPGKAWDNPKFAHLRDKWSYRLDDESTKATRDKVGNASNAHVKRGSIGRTPSMPTLREDVNGSGRMEDPFSPSSSAAAVNKSDFAQLNITSDRIHKCVSQTGAQVDALLEGQQANAKGMQKLQATLERMSQEIETLVQRQQAHEQAMHGAMHGVTYLLEDNASNVKAVSERPQHEIPSEDGWQKLQDEVAQNTAHLETLVNSQQTAVKSIKGMETALEKKAPDTSSTESLQRIKEEIAQNSAQLEDLAKGQKTAKKSMKDLQAAFEQSKPEPPSAASLQRIEDELAQNSAKLSSLAEGQTTAKNSMHDLQTAFEQTKPESLSAQDLQRLQGEVTQNSTYLKALTDGQRIAKKSMAKLQLSLDQQQAQQQQQQNTPTLPPAATAAQVETLQASISANSTSLATVLDGQKTTRSRLAKLSTDLAATQTAQTSLAAQLASLALANAETNALLKRLAKEQKAAAEQQRLAAERSTAAFATQMAQMQKLFAAQQEAAQRGMAEMSRSMGQMSDVLGYEVVPPPKKLHREIIGYVYSRP